MENNTNNRVGIGEKQKFALEVLKEGTVTTLKTGGYSLKIGYPYILSTGAIVLFFGLFNRWPFQLDKIKCQLYAQKTITLNEPTKTVTSKDFDQNNIEIIMPWQQLTDGTYVRNVTKYPIDNFTEEEVKKILNSGEGFKVTDEKKVETRVDTAKTLTVEQSKNINPSIVVTIYNKVENEFIIVEEEIEIEKFLSITEIVFAIIAIYWITKKRYYDMDGYSISDLVDNIKEVISDFKDNKEKLKEKYQRSIR